MKGSLLSQEKKEKFFTWLLNDVESREVGGGVYEEAQTQCVSTMRTLENSEYLWLSFSSVFFFLKNRTFPKLNCIKHLT